MSPTAPPAYGLWTLAIINALVFIIFAFSFATPQSPRDWRSFGAFSAFIVALFAERRCLKKQRHDRAINASVRWMFSAAA